MVAEVLESVVVVLKGGKVACDCRGSDEISGDSVEEEDKDKGDLGGWGALRGRRISGVDASCKMLKFDCW